MKGYYFFFFLSACLGILFINTKQVLFIGLNIVFSSSFTALQKPFHSIVVAALRGLILPVICIFQLPYLLQETGLYLAVPVAEFITILLAYYLWKNTKVIRDINTNLVKCV